MDLAYLLALQNLRSATNDLFTPFLEGISEFVISFWPLAALYFIYWVVNKRIGTFLLFTYVGATLLNGFIKLAACVYRPWIRDAAIVPAGDSITTATGYSFPSGHSTIATAIYGGSAVCLWNHKKLRAAAVALAALTLLTMFSRNYLGVHTPQDVVVGCAVTFALIFVNRRVLAWAEAPVKNRDLAFFFAGVAAAAAVVVYISVKSYPLDYVDGHLLVDPEQMKPDTFGSVGGALGFLIGWLAERRLIKFDAEGNRKRAAAVAVAALVPLFFWHAHFIGAASGAIGLSAAKFTMQFVESLYVLVLVPAVIRALPRAHS